MLTLYFQTVMRKKILAFTILLGIALCPLFGSAQRDNSLFETYFDESTDTKYEYLTYNDKLSGPFKKYVEGNLTEEGWLIENQAHSEWRQYSKTGKKLAEVHYVLGKKHGTWKIWDEEGNLRYKYSYNRGKPTGKWVMYGETGEVLQTKDH
ncbi:hypothetical protein FRX97_06810 [Luteibaculum oceani]|uniref:Toxin-antitoxin system YwqK family antitoxin n=2 Tax=Luteibaculum oceani TaxID=1294296 RepID=A0A5C6V150_9FLAO|nr:hypothetical protein FRX97_06810 [Luteibaculum oceani]